MCRGFDQSGDHEALKIKAFYTRLRFSHHQPSSDSDPLTLHFPPRINGGPLQIDGAGVRSDAPAFLTLHREVNSGAAVAVYCSRERLQVAEGSRFEIYAGDVRVVRGTLRKDDNDWSLDCKASGGDSLVSEADVWVETAAAAEEAVLRERVKIGRRRSRITGCGLEEIPEQRECEYSGCCCCDGGGGGGGGECEAEVEVDGVRWAVDVGIWVACLGVGYLVSKASRSRNRNVIKKLI